MSKTKRIKISRLIISKQVVSTAIKLSIIVGTILGLINHGTDIVNNTLSSKQILQIMVTYLVPYSVSTYSSIKSIMCFEKINSE
ncbi:nitrate/nitrite transporter NrtS [Halosquirtibacter xylanolyticus]|uniref:nitrate/nitrite transporter NrtS n=1 Tax=Halosquirtibacter xylanolyticus TaxID=3374599 RepID=UPI0037491566|nr:nitrate/nitrite transporter NrtS [Prolixibacteraceae bacterium]